LVSDSGLDITFTWPIIRIMETITEVRGIFAQGNQQRPADPANPPGFDPSLFIFSLVQRIYLFISQKKDQGKNQKRKYGRAG
jgi:hypothetical protein